jgi:hypothetical protein
VVRTPSIVCWIAADLTTWTGVRVFLLGQHAEQSVESVEQEMLGHRLASAIATRIA